VNVKPANSPNFPDNGNTGAIPCPRAINPNSKGKNNSSSNPQKFKASHRFEYKQNPERRTASHKTGHPNERTAAPEFPFNPV